MVKKCSKCGLKFKKEGLFIGGLVVGAAGLTILSSKEAKKLCTRAVVCGFKVRACLGKELSTVKQYVEEVIAEAKNSYGAVSREATGDSVADAQTQTESAERAAATD